MAIRFNCPRCQAPNSWPNDSEGTTVACPQCSQRIAIPTNVATKTAVIPPVAPIKEETADVLPVDKAIPVAIPASSVSLWNRWSAFGDTVRPIVWALLLPWIGVCILVYQYGQSHADSAIQQAVVSADTAALLLGGYVFARAIEKLTKG
jgi:DNA-directed RNA polymerase subunit RPC12/RpoP